MSTFPTDYRLRMPLAIQSSKIDGEDLTNFTVLITRNMLNDAVVDPSNANASQADGGDLAFSSDITGATRLACDVISWEHDSVTSASDAAILVAVKVPTVSNTANTTIFMWYDTVGTDTQPLAAEPFGQYAAYDSNWWAFYPLVANDTTNRVANNLPLTAFGTLTPPTLGGATGLTATPGLGATFFDGTDAEYLSTTKLNEVTFAAEDQLVTLEAWANIAILDENTPGLLAVGKNASRNAVAVGTSGTVSGGVVYSRVTGIGVSVSTDNTTTSPDVNAQWAHVVGRDHPTGPVAGIQVGYNGVIRATNATDWSEETGLGYEFGGDTARININAGVNFGNDDLNVPRDVDTTYAFCCFHSTARSDAWIKASYEQINDPAAFAVSDTPTAPLSGPPVNTVAPVISKVV